MPQNHKEYDQKPFSIEFGDALFADAGNDYPIIAENRAGDLIQEFHYKFKRISKREMFTSGWINTSNIQAKRFAWTGRNQMSVGIEEEYLKMEENGRAANAKLKSKLEKGTIDEADVALITALIAIMKKRNTKEQPSI